MALRIGELARRTGVEVGTLRAWERRFGLLSPTRSSGGQRQYAETDITRVLTVRRLIDEGLTVGAAAERVVSAGDGGPPTEPESRLLQQILQTLDQGILVGKDARTRYANRRAAQMLACSVEDLLNRTILDFVPEDERASAMAQMTALRQGEVPEPFDQRIRRADGTTFIAESLVRPMFDRAGRYEGSVAIMRDVTEQRAVEDRDRFRVALLDAIAVLGARALTREPDRSSPEDSVLHETLEATRMLLDAARATFFEVQDGGALQVRAAVPSWAPTTVLAGTGSLPGFTVLSRTVVVVEDVAHERRFDPASLDSETGSAVAAPVFGHRGVRGVLCAERAAVSSFDDSATYFLQAMANVVGTALL